MSRTLSHISLHQVEDIAEKAQSYREEAAKRQALIANVNLGGYISRAALVEAAAEIEVLLYAASELEMAQKMVGADFHPPYQPGEQTDVEHVTHALALFIDHLKGRVLNGSDDTWSGPGYRNDIARDIHHVDIQLLSGFMSGLVYTDGEGKRHYLYAVDIEEAGVKGERLHRAREAEATAAAAQRELAKFGRLENADGKRVSAHKVSPIVRKTLPEGMDYFGSDATPNGIWADGVRVKGHGRGAVVQFFVPQVWVQTEDTDEDGYGGRGHWTEDTEKIAAYTGLAESVGVALRNAGIVAHVVDKETGYLSLADTAAVVEVHATGWATEE